MHVTALYISPGHNFFGHYGGSPGAHPALAVPEVECVAGQGLRGDRFFGHKKDYKGQITFFAREIHDELRRALALPETSPGAYRRNVITLGVDLNALIGREFELQGVRFAGVAECSPCLWMDQALAPGAESLLRGRGGLRARILTSGPLRLSAP